MAETYKATRAEIAGEMTAEGVRGLIAAGKGTYNFAVGTAKTAVAVTTGAAIGIANAHFIEKAGDITCLMDDLVGIVRPGRIQNNAADLGMVLGFIGTVCTYGYEAYNHHYALLAFPAVTNGSLYLGRFVGQWVDYARNQVIARHTPQKKGKRK